MRKPNPFKRGYYDVAEIAEFEGKAPDAPKIFCDFCQTLHYEQTMKEVVRDGSDQKCKCCVKCFKTLYD